MRKFLGAISTKTLAIAGAGLLIAGGAFFAFSGKVSSDPKMRIINALANVETEFTKTSEDFTPGFGIEKMNKKLNEDGISSMDLNLNTNYFATFGVDKAGVQITTKNIPKDKKSEADISISIGNLSTINAKLTSIGSNFYMNIPSLYEKAVLINFETVGADLQSESIVKVFGDTSNLKDLKMDLYSTPPTVNALKKDYIKYINSELITLGKNTVIEKVETDKNLSDTLTNLGSKKTDLEQFNIKIKSEDVKNILLKSIDYYIDLQKKQLSGADISNSYKQFNNAKEDLKNAEFPEEFNLKAVLSKDTITVLSIKGKNNENVNIYFAGEKNTTDKISMQFVEENGNIRELLKFETTTGDKNTMTMLMSDSNATFIANFIANYNPSDKTTDMIFEIPDTSLSLKGKYEDVKEGVGYNFIIDDFTISAPSGDKISLKGNISVSTEKPAIQSPSESVEILKSTEGELLAIMQAISTNAQTNYAPIISLLLMGGGF